MRFFQSRFGGLTKSTTHDVTVTTVHSRQAARGLATQQKQSSDDDAGGEDIAICPGEGPRYGDFKCNHDGTHRVCAQLLDSETKKPLAWGANDFWAITGQKQWQWDKQIRSEPNPGDSWCICMWATARLIIKYSE